jgi:hypothetical protein
MNALAEIAKWCEECGLGTPKHDGYTLDDVINIKNLDLDILPFQQLESICQALAAFNVYISSIKGTLKAQLIYAEKNYKDNLYNKIQSQQYGKYTSKEEKEQLALSTSYDLIKLLNDKTAIQMKLSKIENLPIQIGSYINIIRMVHNRRMRGED